MPSSSSPLLSAWRRSSELDAVAVVDDAHGETDWRTLDARARAVAASLLTSPITVAPRERVALLVAPGASFLEAFFGVLLAGGTVVVLSPLHPEPETTYFCDDAGVRTILVSADLASHLAPPTVAGRRVVDVAALASTAPADPVPGRELPDVAADAPALQLYTSGTTGKPKGAVITHENLGVQARLLDDAWAVSRDDVLLHALPLHHMHGLAIALLTAVAAGATTRMLPAFDARRVWDEMPRATVFMAVPTMYQRLFAAFDQAEDATRAKWAASARALRLATSGSAALPVGLAERWRAITGEIPVERFGMTEIGVGMTNPLAGPRKPGHVGHPLPSVEARIVGDDGADAASGELWIRGPSVFAGYHERPDATRAAFAADGWFRTGDTVTRDADGWFKILGRTSVDILKSGGYKLSALEIEEVLREHPAVAEVAVVGVPDEAWGERVVACVVARAGREPECAEEAVRAFAKQKLAPYKVPKQVVLMADLPRNPVGKVVKPRLVDRLAGAR
jgi:malonyl-CoA/methylmalonyl-CoA synthetase